VPASRRLLRALVAAALLLALAPAAQARREVPRGWLGVTVDGPMTAGEVRDEDWDLMAGSGVETARTAFYWSELQPAPDRLELARTDALVLAAARRGIAVLPVVLRAPDWAARTPGDLASPPRSAADYAAFLQALVARYGPRGSLWSEHTDVRPRPIRAWQIWNEPSLPSYWNEPDWAAGYVRLARAARAALHRADRGAVAVAAGLPNRSWESLRAIYRAGGRGAFDSIAIHPYTSTPANVVRLLRYARREMRRGRDARRPLWVTELSWPASKGVIAGVPGFTTTEGGQASRLRRVVPLLAAARRALHVEIVLWYTWLSADVGSPNAFAYSGLRRLRDGRAISMPSLRAFAGAAERIQGCAKPLGNARRCR
jgi:hypothetical protein